MCKRAASAGKSYCPLLQPVFDQFVEGVDTADLKAAEQLLAGLSWFNSPLPTVR
jgi:hypothetical protein